MSWAQPLCTACWIAEATTEEGTKTPTTLKRAGRQWHELVETCCQCGRFTTAQIFVRRDPDTVNHPRRAAIG